MIVNEGLGMHRLYFVGVQGRATDLKSLLGEQEMWQCTMSDEQCEGEMLTPVNAVRNMLAVNTT